MGVIGFNYFADLSFSQIVVNNVVSFSEWGNAVLLGGLNNASLWLSNSTLTSKVTNVVQNDIDGIIVGQFSTVSCIFTIQNTRLNLQLVNGTSVIGVFGLLAATTTVTASITNLTLNVTLQCFQNISGTLIKATWTTVGCT